MLSGSKLYTLERLSNLVVIFWIYISFSPTLRILLIGGKESANICQLFITAVPDILVMLLVLFAFMVWLKGARFSLKTFDWLLLIYVTFNVVYGFILSKDIFISAEGFRTTYLIIIFYFISRMYINAEPAISEKLLMRIFGWYIIYSALGILFHFIFPGFEKHLIMASMHIESEYFIVRMGAFLLTPVLFGTFAAMGCAYFYYRLVMHNASWKNYAAVAILWLAVFLSVSRGPIITFLIAFVLLTIFSRQWKRSMLILLIIMSISVTVSYILIGDLYPLKWVFSSAADTLGMSKGVTRVELWKHSMNDFYLHPIGYGLGHSGAVAVRYLKNANIPAALYTTDGWYLKLACETGIFGLLTYVLLSAFLFVKGIKFVIKNSMTYFSFAFVAFFMVNTQNVVENVLDFYPYIFVYWMIIGFGINTIIRNQKQPMA